jgi:hypothetical protein
MAIDYDTRVSVSPQPPQDGRWAIFAQASFKNMALGEAELSTRKIEKQWSVVGRQKLESI